MTWYIPKPQNKLSGTTKPNPGGASRSLSSVLRNFKNGYMRMSSSTLIVLSSEKGLKLKLSHAPALFTREDHATLACLHLLPGGF